VVDEAQDCSTADLYILNKLYDVGLPLVVVADPDQAIYGFRGAATHALTSLAGRLGRHDLTHKRHDTWVSEKSMKMDSAPPPAWFLGLHWLVTVPPHLGVLAVE